MSDEYIKKSDAIIAVAEHLMGEALLDSADASDDIEDWKEIAVAILENIPPADAIEIEILKAIGQQHYDDELGEAIEMVVEYLKGDGNE